MNAYSAGSASTDTMASASSTRNKVSVSWSCMGQVNPIGVRRGKGIHVWSATSRSRILRTGEAIGFWREALRPDAAWRPPVPILAVLGAEDGTGNIAPAARALADRDPAVRLEVLADA